MMYPSVILDLDHDCAIVRDDENGTAEFVALNSTDEFEGEE